MRMEKEYLNLDLQNQGRIFVFTYRPISWVFFYNFPAVDVKFT